MQLAKRRINWKKFKQMLNKKNIILVLFGIVAVFLAFLYISANSYSIHGNKIKKISLDGNIFRAEMVSSPEKMQKGMGERKKICQKCAMLFQFSDSKKHPFWMKGMLFPLDIVWISNGKIVHIEKNVSEKFSGVLSPQTEADQVLEINAGLADEMGVKIGDSMVFL